MVDPVTPLTVMWVEIHLCLSAVSLQTVSFTTSAKM